MSPWTSLNLAAALGLALALDDAALAAPAAPAASAYCPVPAAGIGPLAGRPTRSVKEFGAVGDGVTDDGAALQRALDGVTPGTILDFPAGTYPYADILTLARNDVVLRGEGAVLRARNPARQALMIGGDRAAVIGLTLLGAARERLDSLESAQLVITGRFVQVVGNTVSGGASAGIFAFGARDFRIAGNHVHTTKADGIHITEGARDGMVEANRVHETGDDLIAVVSYRPRADQQGKSTLSRNILIRGNTVWANNWGRGITVVGGEDVAIIGNSIRNIPAAAGIYLSQENAYRTYGDRRITVADNYVAEVQTRRSPSGAAHPRHGAIDINSSNEAPHEFFDIENNVVEGAGFAGIRLLGEVCHVRLANNTLKAVGGRPIEVIRDLYHGTCADSSVQCRGNTVDGAATLADGACDDRVGANWRTGDRPQGATWASCGAP